MNRPFANAPVYETGMPWQPVAAWPAHWVHPPADWARPWVALFRLRFTLDRAISDVLHVTADERYELYLDRIPLGQGPERGDRANWHYESYPVDLAAGAHTLMLRVWALGDLAPWAQISVKPGFFLCPESAELIPLLATGQGHWEIRRMEGTTFHSGNAAAGTALGGGPYERVDFNIAESAYTSVEVGVPGTDGFHLLTLKPIHWLRPATLPERAGDVWESSSISRLVGHHPDRRAWERLLTQGEPLLLPAGTEMEAWIDLTDYVCGYPALAWSGGAGARIQIGFAEAPREVDGPKLRDPAEWYRADPGPPCPYDELLPDGIAGATWFPHWWRCGRLMIVRVTTGAAPLRLESIGLYETRYPLEPESTWNPSDSRLNALFRICLRSLQMCAHETYMDCPYYEQLMYAGDTRIQCLLTYALTTDARLPRKAVAMFDASRLNPSGWTTDAYPTNEGKIIPPFSFWWVAMVHDYALWRGDPDFVRERLAGVRAILDLAWSLRGDDGLLTSPKGWNFVDSTYPGHVPPGGEPGGRNCAFNLQFMLACRHAEFLEEFCGEREITPVWRARYKAVFQGVRQSFWNAERGLYADDPSHGSFSEQAQCLALLATPFAKAVVNRLWEHLEAPDSGLLRCGPYFTHYLFEAALRHGRTRLFWSRLEPWLALPDQGFKTTPETFGATRSDCHAWSAHPLYHYLTGILGLSPSADGVSITPRLRDYPGHHATGSLAHRKGRVHVGYTRQVGDRWRAEITLPKGLTGELHLPRGTSGLKPGTQVIEIFFPDHDMP